MNSLLQISPGYCIPSALTALQIHFLKNGTVFLGDVLRDSSLKSISSAISSEKTSWVKKSIPDRYSYSMLLKNSSFLKNDWGLSSLISLISHIDSSVHKEYGADILKFSHGDYTLLHDYDKFSGVVGFVCLDDFESGFGGDIVITVAGSTLYRITAVKNMLVLVKLDSKTRIFVKYLNVDAGKRYFRIIRLSSINRV